METGSVAAVAAAAAVLGAVVVGLEDLAAWGKGAHSGGN